MQLSSLLQSVILKSPHGGFSRDLVHCGAENLLYSHGEIAMETDCLILGLAECGEFTIPRRVCELDSVVTRDTYGSHFLRPFEGQQCLEKPALDFSLGMS